MKKSTAKKKISSKNAMIASNIASVYLLLAMVLLPLANIQRAINNCMNTKRSPIIAADLRINVDYSIILQLSINSRNCNQASDQPLSDFINKGCQYYNNNDCYN